jgi:putative DNA primase/helicase
MSKSMLEMALAYAVAKNMPVFPVHWPIGGACSCGDAECKKVGKHPRTLRGFLDATTNAAQVKMWWTQAPDANIGVPTGHSTFCVLDVDPRNGGDVTLQLLIEQHGPLPATACVRTGSNGRHFYFKCPPNLRCGTNRFGPGLDLKAEGGYVVVPPSKHVSGASYESITSGVAIAEPPTWVLAMAEPPKPQPKPTPSFTFDANEEQRLMSALGTVDPNPRDIWVKVGAGLAHALGEQGRLPWDRWSAKSPKFDEKDQDRTWRSFKPHPNPAGLGTVYWMAKQAGWTGSMNGNHKASGGPSVSSDSGSPGPSPEFEPLKPLPPQLLPVEPFDAGLLPEAFQPWVLDIANRIQCPVDFPAAAALVTFSSIVGRQVGIRPKRRDNWTVVPNLWGAVIGRPGVMKTPAIAQPVDMLWALEKTAKATFEKDLEAFEADSMVSEAANKEREQEIRKRVQKNRAEALGLAKAIVADKVKAPTRRRYITSDPTVEKVGELLATNGNGITIFRDELTGFLRSLDREGNESARAFHLEAWNGSGPFTYDRIGRGTIEIEAACESVFGGIQPGPLQTYLAGALRGTSDDDGLIQRFQVLVWPDVSSDWTNVDQWPDTAARKRAVAVFEWAAHIDAEAIGAEVDEDGGIPYLRFDDEAQDLFDEWRAKLEHQVRSQQDPLAIEAHLSKYRSLVPSIALLCHLADKALGRVSITAVHKAIAWARYLESHARRMFGSVLSNGVEARAIAKRIQDGDLEDGFCLRDVYRPGWTSLPDYFAASRGVDLLMRLGWLAEQEVVTAGRPSTIYSVNPQICRKGQGGN